MLPSVMISSPRETAQIGAEFRVVRPKNPRAKKKNKVRKKVSVRGCPPGATSPSYHPRSPENLDERKKQYATLRRNIEAPRSQFTGERAFTSSLCSDATERPSLFYYLTATLTRLADYAVFRIPGGERGKCLSQRPA